MPLDDEGDNVDCIIPDDGGEVEPDVDDDDPDPDPDPEPDSGPEDVDDDEDDDDADELTTFGFRNVDIVLLLLFTLPL